ncbi:MAG TPA: aminotransferase class IV [Gaiellaceae bacterium]|nr:aminotransferase class IV [Gaiellaceae bacterium]
MTALLAAAVAGVGLVDPAEPVFHPDDEALLRGAAAFETVRIRRGRPVLLRPHVERLERSSRSLRLPPPEGAAVLAAEATEAAGTDQGVLRLFRTGMTLLATVGPLPAGLVAMRGRGIAVVTVRSHDAGLLTGVKATSYATALAAVAEAERHGADDAIYLGEGGTVLEATMSNVWWREDDVLVTPSLATGVLPGVTRGAVAAIARAAGYRIREGSFTLSSLLRADEAFTSSAVREIMPVSAVDGRELSRGEAAARLQEMLEDITDEYPEDDD